MNVYSLYNVQSKEDFYLILCDKKDKYNFILVSRLCMKNYRQFFSVVLYIIGKNIKKYSNSNLCTVNALNNLFCVVQLF